MEVFVHEGRLPERIDLGQGYEMGTQKADGANLYYISVISPKGKQLTISHDGKPLIGPLSRDEVEGWKNGLMLMFKQ